MNWILPAYEIMWRVVLRDLIEVRFRGAIKEEHQEGWLPAIGSKKTLEVSSMRTSLVNRLPPPGIYDLFPFLRSRYSEEFVS